MKKTLILSLLVMFLITCYPKTNAQSNLFAGVKSGMTYSQFISHCKSSSYFSVNGDEITVVMNYRTYNVNGYFNKNGELWDLVFMSKDVYYSSQYYKVKENARELYDIASVNFGTPDYNVWVDYYNVPLNNFTIVCSFKNNNLSVAIAVYNIVYTYNAALTILDYNYYDGTTENGKSNDNSRTDDTRI